jgi:hypothetical protein
MADSWNGLMQHAVTLGDLMGFIGISLTLASAVGLVLVVLTREHDRENP